MANRDFASILAENSLRRLGLNTYFGEIGLLHETQRTTTVRAAIETLIKADVAYNVSTLFTRYNFIENWYETASIQLCDKELQILEE